MPVFSPRGGSSQTAGVAASKGATSSPRLAVRDWPGIVCGGGRPSGRVTSSRWSDELGRAIGLAWLPPELAEENAAFEIRVDGRLEPAHVRLRPFFDPDGERLRA